MQPAAPERKTFSTHLSEFRFRLLIVIAFLLTGTVIGYFLHESILFFLLKPINQPLYYSSPAGGLDFTLKISFFFGCLVSIPVLVYQLLRFIQPAFPHKLQCLMPRILLISCLLVLCGMSFAYFVSLPASLYFLNKFSTSQIQSLISTTEYFSFITRYIFGFGLLFQLPLALIVVNSVKKISPSVLMRYQRWVILSSFIAAAILTPTPDLFNQLIMAVPLILLYEISVLVILFLNQKKA